MRSVQMASTPSACSVFHWVGSLAVHAMTRAPNRVRGLDDLLIDRIDLLPEILGGSIGQCGGGIDVIARPRALRFGSRVRWLFTFLTTR